MAKSNPPSVHRLRALLKYNADTGLFFWIKNGKQAGTILPRGYVQIGIDRKVFYAHRLAWAIHHGAWPKEGIDHINHIRSDNRISNLRSASQKENSRNCKPSKNNTSGFTGVFWNKQCDKWAARIKVNGKLKHLGLYDRIEDAAIARKKADKIYRFHENHGLN